MHQILDKINDEPYFKWPNKMGGDLMKLIKVFIVSITKIEDTLLRSAGLCGIISSS